MPSAVPGWPRRTAAGLIDFEARLGETAEAFERAFDRTIVKGTIRVGVEQD